MAHGLANGPLCRSLVADHPHPSFAIGAHCLAQSLPPIQGACPHGLERIANVIETPLKAGNERVVTPVEDESEDEAEKESTRICLFLGKDWRDGISADVYRDSSDNWISERLVPNSENIVEPGQRPVKYRGPDGIRLESKGCVKVFWRPSPQKKIFSGAFQVHASRSGPPDVILGKPWAQRHGATVLSSGASGTSKDNNAQRRPGSDRQGGFRRNHNVSQSTPGKRIMKLPQRDANNRGRERSSW